MLLRGETMANNYNDDLISELQTVPRAVLARITGVKPSRITDWINSDLASDWFDPITKRCDCPAFIRWYLKKETAGGDNLKTKKLEQEIAYKEAQTKKLEGTVIDRSEHEKILASRAASLRQFLEQTAILNAAKFVGLSLDEVRTCFLELFRMAMDAYVGAKVDDSDENSDLF